jgi:tetratricopeptide (TPR) repeat protein
MSLYMQSLISTMLGLLLTIASFAQPSFDTWEAESKINKRLLPRCGHLPKTQAEIKSDSDYIKQLMASPQFKTRRDASNHMIGLGFQYYYRPDFKTAMYRFNQAYLLDSTNTDIFWGYGAIYMAFGQYELAQTQYLTGLSIDSTNTHLLTDMGTYFMEQYYLMAQMPKNDMVKEPKLEAKRFMDSALHYLTKSYLLDKKDMNTTYKLSICYWNIEDCNNAWKYYDSTVALGGRPITEEYTKDLKNRCKRK